MDLGESLRQWVDAGLIDDRQALSIEEFEATRPPSDGVGRGTEAVAYVGVVLVLVALGILAGQFWDEIATWGKIGLAAGATLIVFGLGWVLGRSQVAAINRAQTFAWFLVVGGVAFTMAVALAEATELDVDNVSLITSLSALLVALVLWLTRSSVLQELALAASAGVTTLIVIARFDDAPEWLFGVSLSVLGLAWLILTYTGVMKPERTGYALAGLGLLLISVPEGSSMPWPAIGLVIAIGLMVLSVRINMNVLLGFGVAGLFVYIPMTIFEWFGDSLGVPIALLITGVVLIGVVVASVRLRREVDSG